MDFGFHQDQTLLRDTLRSFLEPECTPAWIRARWDTETGRDRGFWKRLAEIGLPGLLVPEAQGGLGLDDVDGALLLEETGRAALAEPVVATLVGSALLAGLGAGGDAPELARDWLPRIAAGDAVVAVGHPASPFVADAHVADLLLLAAGDALYAVPRGSAYPALEAQPANDGSQRLFRATFEGGAPPAETRVAEGPRARALGDAALDRGALATAAQALGVGDRLLELAVAHAGQRVQFGAPIGSFQAVKHMLADVQVALAYARSHVYRAAWSVARATPGRAVEVSMAKLAACEAAGRAARVSLQVHGAIGYTYEQDLHVWLKRAGSLERAWGDRVFHAARLRAGVIDGTLPAQSFGYQPPEGLGPAGAARTPRGLGPPQAGASARSQEDATS